MTDQQQHSNPKADAKAAKAYAKAMRPWYKKKGVTTLAALAFIVIAAIAMNNSGGGSSSPSASDSTTSTTSNTDSNAGTETAPTQAAAPDMTSGQQQAVGAAQDYLNSQAFSKKGLVDQLSSPNGSGFARADAVYAVNHIDVDWNNEAAKAAKEYLDSMHFSRSGLIEQLESPNGSQFTHAQAVYGVNQAGL